jgi:hypothetical protein
MTLLFNPPKKMWKDIGQLTAQTAVGTAGHGAVNYLSNESFSLIKENIFDKAEDMTETDRKKYSYWASTAVGAGATVGGGYLMYRQRQLRPYAPAFMIGGMLSVAMRLLSSFTPETFNSLKVKSQGMSGYMSTRNRPGMNGYLTSRDQRQIGMSGYVTRDERVGQPYSKFKAPGPRLKLS